MPWKPSDVPLDDVYYKKHTMEEMEKAAIVKLLRFIGPLLEKFKAAVLNGNDSTGFGAAHLTCQCMGVNQRTLERIAAECRESNGIISGRKPGSGRPTAMKPHVKAGLVSFVRSSSRAANPTTLASMSDYSESLGNKVSANTIRRHLGSMGMKHGAGWTRHLDHDSPGTVALRKVYSSLWKANRDLRGLPIRPEVAIDEAAVNLHHTMRRQVYLRTKESTKSLVKVLATASLVRACTSPSGEK